MGKIYADPSPNVPPNAMLKRMTPEWSAMRKLPLRRHNQTNPFALSPTA